jgi:hypothetical protein
MWIGAYPSYVIAPIGIFALEACVALGAVTEFVLQLNYWVKFAERFCFRYDLICLDSSPIYLYTELLSTTGVVPGFASDVACSREVHFHVFLFQTSPIIWKFPCWLRNNFYFIVVLHSRAQIYSTEEDVTSEIRHLIQTLATNELFNLSISSKHSWSFY